VSEFKLCFVDRGVAHFTTQHLEDQWGDDWNDAPYEYNAGRPYRPNWLDEEQGRNWLILCIAFNGDFREPCDGHLNSPYSVQDINNHDAPWVTFNPDSENPTRIWAGTPLAVFVDMVTKAGGEVGLDTV
jgi:hypothetical protein